jgi:hypothetical protein
LTALISITVGAQVFNAPYCQHDAAANTDNVDNQKQTPFLHVAGAWIKCNRDVVDVLIGIFTLSAAGATAYFTFTIWSVNRSQLTHARHVERAYVSGGGAADNHFNFNLTINNYGKTPAMLTHYAVNFCDRRKIPPVPTYRVIRHIATFPPGERARAIVSVPIPTSLPEPVVYGRFWYTDIWGEAHNFGFILNPKNSRFEDEVPDAYTSWT